jgi:UDP-N-acetylmuramoyl-tripeptide--D-alanyl-D-alanine ligase
VKEILKKIIVSIITWQAKIVLKIYKPKIITITGSVGKTSTKDAIFTVLSKFKTVRKSEKSFNSEIGLPLTILGLPNGWSNFFIWLENILKGFSLIFKRQSYPEYLILEVGVGKPGDIKKNVVPWLKPDIVAITLFPDKPVHVEFFESPEEVVEEKSALAYAVRKEGLLILNHDDEKVYALHNKSSCRTVSFGENENATYRIVHPIYLNEQKNDEISLIKGLNFKLEYNGNSFPVSLPKVVGFHNINSVLIAIIIANEIGLDLLSSIKVAESYSLPPGRMTLIEGIKDSIIIDDSYNSSPIAVKVAIDVLKEMKAKRKIAILGDMLELGKFTEKEHRIVGEKVVGVFDVLMTVGPRSKFISESAIENGFNKKNVFSFDNSLVLGEFLKTFIQKGDLFLFKGSQGVRLEKAVVCFMAYPEKREDLLCRQEKEWLNK